MDSLDLAIQLDKKYNLNFSVVFRLIGAAYNADKAKGNGIHNFLITPSLDLWERNSKGKSNNNDKIKLIFDIVVCDSLYIALSLYSKDVDLTDAFCILPKSVSGSFSKRLSYGQNDRSDCDKLLKFYEGLLRDNKYDILVDVLNEHKEDFNDFYCYHDRLNSTEIVLPDTIQAEVQGLVTPCRYRSVEQFKDYMQIHKFKSIEEYSDYLRERLYRITCHNILYMLNKLEKLRPVRMATECIEIQSKLGGHRVALLTEDCLPKNYGNSYFEYVNRIFRNSTEIDKELFKVVEQLNRPVITKYFED